jgi:GNAT superfamily N-acetyltransferase
LVALREATLDDVEQLALLWHPYLRRGPGEDHLHDLRTAIDHASVQPDQRLVVAEYDGDFAGAVFLQMSTYSPVNLDPVLQVHNVAVVPAHRRHGVGKALMECGVTWAEELGIGHVATAASAGSREANRFMARLALGPAAVLRIAPTPAVRSRLAPRYAAARQVTQILAARRSLRSARSTVGGLQ